MRSVRVVITLIILIAVGAGLYWATQNFTTGGNTGGTSGGTSGASAAAGGIPATATQAVVDYVHDGDTLFLTDGRKVRLLGINTPEIGKNLQCYGDEATTLTRQLLPQGTHVWVQHDVDELDQYGRSLLFIYRDDGLNINLELLREGAAVVEMFKPNVLLHDEVYAAEDAARTTGLGLWGACR